MSANWTPAIGRAFLEEDLSSSHDLRVQLRSALDHIHSLMGEIAHLHQLMGPDYHIVDVKESGWGIQHPIACRPDLTGCAVHRAACEQWVGIPAPVGRYRVDFLPDSPYLALEAER